jgi:hypothetical protein
MPALGPDEDSFSGRHALSTDHPSFVIYLILCNTIDMLVADLNDMWRSVEWTRSPVTEIFGGKLVIVRTCV